MTEEGDKTWNETIRR